MLGVVLWSDADDNKAVIWCEDHGDLAFFNGGTAEPTALMEFDAGDLVQFDLSEERHLRYAHNPRRVGHGTYAGIADTLSAATPSPRPAPRPEPAATVPSAEVIPFQDMRSRRRERELVAV